MNLPNRRSGDAYGSLLRGTNWILHPESGAAAWGGKAAAYANYL